MSALLEVRDLSRTFRVRTAPGRTRRHVHAVNGVSFDVDRQRTLALVGESGCGKSTTGLAALRLIEPTSGAITFDATDLRALDRSALRRLRGDMQVVLQDPRAQLDPRMRVADIVAEPFRAHQSLDRTARGQRVDEVLEMVGLGSVYRQRRPGQLSGGQCQRVAIARALATSPKLVVCDEAVSALDVSIQTQVLNLLRDLQGRTGVSYLFISHSLAAVRYVADRIVVMYLGHDVETAPSEEFFAAPAHPYSAALLSAVPSPRVDQPRERVTLSGEVPSAFSPPSGCVFHTRCPRAQSICTHVTPARTQIAPGRNVSCHFPLI